MKYAAIIKSSISIPGDERSRSAPGHGYGEHNIDTIELKEFATPEDCKAWIRTQKASYGSKAFRIIEYQDVEIQTEMVVNFKKPVASRTG